MEEAPGILDALLGETASQPVEGTPSRVGAFAWARVSTEMQEERALSIPEQLREIRDYARKNDFEIVEEFQETGSAFKRPEKRVEFERMVAEAEARPDVSAILVHDLSRFSRDSVRGKSLMRRLRDRGIQVVSLNDPEFDPDTVSGVYMEAITFAKNEAYSREVAFHTRKGCRANVQTRDQETGCCYTNGGQPLWGYRIERLTRGDQRRGHPIVKSIWVPDETIVAGRPTHEWTRHCLTDLAGKGASLEELRDFCNEQGIPAQRGPYWGISTWHSLLQPNTLLKYCGYGVWNVHCKNGSKRPPSEWIITERAHEPLITEDEAQAIAAARRRNVQKSFDKGYGRSRGSRYLLSGGLFVCGRCGSNMIGFRNEKRTYYVCGSQPYRKGMGCGPGVYVPQDMAELEVVNGMRELIEMCSDENGLVRRVNAELRDIWESSTGVDPHATQKINQIDAKIANIRKAVEDGLSDTQWANERLQDLMAERADLELKGCLGAEPPQIDAQTALAYRRDLDTVLQQGDMVERKKLVRSWVQELKLAPEALEVEITYQVPEPVMNCLVAREGFEPPTSRL